MAIVNPYRQLKGAPVQKTASAPTASEVKTALPRAQPRVTAPQKRNLTSAQDETLYDETGTYNPRPFGGYTDTKEGVRAALGSPKGRMFDAKGEINASDKRDALQQIAYLLNNVTKKSGSTFYREASTLQSDERRKVLAAAMRDPTGEGFAIVGQELLLPIKDIIDYEGWARKIFRVRPLAQGELFRVAKDVRSTAWVIGQDGQGIESRLFGKYVTPSEFKVVSFPTVDIEDIYQMNFDVLDRAQDTARQEIELEEDKRALSIIDRASATTNATTIFTTLGVAALEDIWG